MSQAGEQQSGLVQRLSSGSAQVALWLIVVLLAVHATAMLVQPNGGPAYAQPANPAPPGRADGAGVYVVPAQIDSDQWGAFLVDTRAGTIVLYQYNANMHKLKLLAARTFVYDRYLDNYNNAEPTPSDIADLISKARRVEPKPPESSEPNP